MISLRGAITIKENTSDLIKEASIELFEEIIKTNDLVLADICSIIFSCTEDITKDYPGKFVREHFNLKETAIMHFNEMKVENSLPLCIRVMLLINKEPQENKKFVYLRDAKNLRKDLSGTK